MTVRTIADVCLVTDNSRTTPTWTEDGIVVVRSRNIRDGRLDLSAQSSFTDEESFSIRTRRVVPRGGDVIITREAPMGEVCVIPEDLRCCMGQRMVLLRPNPDVILPEYLLYSLLAPPARRQIGIHEGTGSTVSNLRVPMILGLKIEVPSLDEQRGAVTILRALDDKIDLGRRMNEALEATARALFKSWFIDFEPVRAKAKGRKPFGMDTDTAALFPASFEVSEVGSMPTGWKLMRVGEEFRVVMGQSPPGSTYNEEGVGIPFYQGRTDFGFRFPTRRVFCTEPTRLAEPGDTLVSVRAPVGDVNLAAESCAIGRGVAAVRHNSRSRTFTFHVMQSLRKQFEVYESQGTVFGAIGGEQFRALQFVAPPPRVREAFEAVAVPFDDLVAVNERQGRTLASLRDSLLPKLLSGELRVRESEKAVEAVA